ncbi:CarD family transcriptional regulator [Bradyrhizobium sp. Tv2a-2]|uniref:CarD family transcriptional regulator n=1 Tax=Bradyrhizobium sp. Tv2a-2 TaxID=113395 RepID=UPI001FD88C4C|nr:CarD family transcriptional regulator [Bradyrhizobium sp. Tv2a-2]
MNLGSHRPGFDNSDQPHAALADRSQHLELSKTASGFNANDYVVYPAHGVGQILAIQKQAVAGASLEFFVVYFAKNKMTLRVPTQKAANLGMRKLSDHTTIEHVRQTLGQAPNKARSNWSRLVQESASKINSGDIIALAEVIRDLYRPARTLGQSYSDQQLYLVAFERLARKLLLFNGSPRRK